MIRRWFRLRAKARYWRRRALLAETQLEAERWRNVNREDTFVSASVMGSRNMYGVAPREGPAPPRRAPTPPPVPRFSDPMDALTWLEKEEFKQNWLVQGEAQGLSRQQIQRDFLEEIANRKTLVDEPMPH